MGRLDGYFVLQKGAWAHTFDYGGQTLDVFANVAVGGATTSSRSPSPT